MLTFKEELHLQNMTFQENVCDLWPQQMQPITDDQENPMEPLISKDLGRTGPETTSNHLL